MHLTGGILRHFQAFSTPEQNPALKVLSTSAHPQVTQTVETVEKVKGYNLAMAVVVSLRDMVDEMQTLSHESNAYLKKSTGKVITIRDDDFDFVRSMDEIFDEVEEDVNEVESNNDSSGYSDLEAEFFQDVKNVMVFDEDYLKLPSKFDIHEYEIMERFGLSLPNEKISDTLLSKIRGSGAFRRFRDTIYQFGIEEDWFKYRDEAYKEIAISWLESHGFDYIDDMNKREKNV